MVLCRRKTCASYTGRCHTYCCDAGGGREELQLPRTEAGAFAGLRLVGVALRGAYVVVARRAPNLEPLVAP
jgi:hypothetical protein